MGWWWGAVPFSTPPPPPQPSPGSATDSDRGPGCLVKFFLARGRDPNLARDGRFRVHSRTSSHTAHTLFSHIFPLTNFSLLRSTTPLPCRTTTPLTKTKSLQPMRMYDRIKRKHHGKFPIVKIQNLNILQFNRAYLWESLCFVVSQAGACTSCTGQCIGAVVGYGNE